MARVEKFIKDELVTASPKATEAVPIKVALASETIPSVKNLNEVKNGVVLIVPEDYDCKDMLKQLSFANKNLAGVKFYQMNYAKLDDSEAVGATYDKPALLVIKNGNVLKHKENEKEKPFEQLEVAFWQFLAENKIAVKTPDVKQGDIYAKGEATKIFYSLIELQNPEIMMKLGAVLGAAAKAKPEEVVPYLKTLSEDEKPEVKAVALWGLGKAVELWGGKPGELDINIHFYPGSYYAFFDNLKDGLKSDSLDINMAAAWSSAVMFTAFNFKTYVLSNDPMFKSLQDKVGEVVDVLGELVESDNKLLSQTAALALGVAAQKLDLTPHALSVVKLTRVADSENSKVRYAAAMALGSTLPKINLKIYPEVLDALTTLLNDKDPQVQLAAIKSFTLAAISLDIAKYPKVLAAHITLLNDPNAEVGQGAALFLVQAGQKNAELVKTALAKKIKETKDVAFQKKLEEVSNIFE
ncbi:MAG: HEAT repeat domain-containing protein [Candidatus Micrarchaeota archaeon]